VSVLLATVLLALQEVEFAHSAVLVVDPDARLALCDVDADDDEDLVVLDAGGAHVRLQGADGTFSGADDVAFPWPAANLAWTLVDAAGDGRTVLAAFVEGREVRTYRLDVRDGAGTGDAGTGETVLAFDGRLPRGRYEMRFFRDVDGDGRSDLVLPAAGRFAVHLRGAEGSWSAPLEVELATDVDLEVGDPRALDATFGQEVDIPWFRVEDVDGDGRADLVAETDDAVQFHLAAPALSSTPTWTLDLAALEAELPPEGDLDLGNVLGEATRRVAWRIEDLDGRPPHDLVVQVGRKFRVYRDAAATGPLDAVPQVLKASGNVLLFLLRDVEGDALPELQLLRAQELSLATILRWLVLPGSFDLELFTYANEGGTFSRRPTRRNTIAVEIPRLLAFAKELEELEEELEAAEDVPAMRAALGTDGVADDVLDVVGDELLVHLDRATDPADEGFEAVEELDDALEVLFLNDLDGLDDGQGKTYDLRELIESTLRGGAALRERTAGVEPDLRIPLEPGLVDPSLHARDLNGDGLPDLLVVDQGPGADPSEASGTSAGSGAFGWRVQLLVRRPR